MPTNKRFDAGGGRHPRRDSEHERRNVSDENRASRDEGMREEGIRGAVRETAGQLASTAGEAFESAREAARDTLAGVPGALEAVWKDARDLMRRYPLATFGLGFALGFFAALSLRERIR